MATSLRRIATHSPQSAWRSSLTLIRRQFASDALVEIKPGEIGMVSGIPEEHLRRRVVIFSPARTASQQGSGKVGKWKINFLSTKKNGKDIQGFARKRVTIETSEKCKIRKKDGLYYDLRYNAEILTPAFSHFQLRNMIAATSKHDVNMMSHFSVMHWSSLTRVQTEILDLLGNVVPCEKYPESLSEGFTKTEVSTIAMKDRLFIAGGKQGELIVKHLDKPGICFYSQPTTDDYAITTAIDIYNIDRSYLGTTIFQFYTFHFDITKSFSPLYVHNIHQSALIANFSS